MSNNGIIILPPVKCGDNITLKQGSKTLRKGTLIIPSFKSDDFPFDNTIQGQITYYFESEDGEDGTFIVKGEHLIINESENTQWIIS